MQPFSLAVIIVNFNAGDALIRCVESVLAQKLAAPLIVIDNQSMDDSARRVENLFGRAGELTVVQNTENVGFSRAVNQAAKLDSCASADFLLVLNPDCEFQPGALRRLLEALQSDRQAGLAGPLVIDRHGQPMRGTLRRFPDPWRGFLTFSGLWRLGRLIPAFQGVEPEGELPTDNARAEAVSGACMLVRKSVFDQAGGMDEAYGLHCEDLDLMYRFRQLGHPSLFVPSSRVYHVQGISSRSRPLWVHWQKHRGMQRFFSKFQATAYAMPLRWLVITGIWLRFAVTLPLVIIRS